jgi:non-heme chloroperoxidase
MRAPAVVMQAKRHTSSLVIHELLSHGWLLNPDAWDEQLNLVAANGFRAIAHDRRGHGRSSQPWIGNDLDAYADDLAELIEQLDLRDVILVGHSTGGGEVTRFIGRHGTARRCEGCSRQRDPAADAEDGEEPPAGCPLRCSTRCGKR